MDAGANARVARQSRRGIEGGRQRRRCPMRSFALLLASASLAGCATSKQAEESEPDASSRYTFWRPAPVADAPDPNAAVSEAPASAWRTVAAENLLVMELREGGRVVIELAPDFAPVHVANVRAF